MNTRSIAVSFDVVRAGNSGIKATEIWVRSTEQKDWEWQLLDRKKGLVQPFKTALPGQGNYSIRVVLVGGSGMTRLADARAVDVEVDMTPPTAKLLGLKPASDDAKSVEITWKAEDKNFDEKAIDLQYSWDGKAWLPINVDALPNTGSYTWTLPEGANHEVQLKLTARDRAGNETEAYLPEKLSLDRVVPQAKITGVVKGEEGPEILPMPKVLQQTETPPATRFFDEPPTYPEDKPVEKMSGNGTNSRLNLALQRTESRLCFVPANTNVLLQRIWFLQLMMHLLTSDLNVTDLVGQ